MAKRSPRPVDEFVGQRIRMARLMMQPSMSQGALGEKIGVTFQQVQKYERGTNRVGASRMVQIAQALGRPVAWFFDEQASSQKKGAQADQDIVQSMMVAPCGLQVATAYLALGNHDRHLVLDLVNRLTGAKPARQAKAA